jgi:hypothetical protein
MNQRLNEVQKLSVEFYEIKLRFLILPLHERQIEMELMNSGTSEANDMARKKRKVEQ